MRFDNRVTCDGHTVTYLRVHTSKIFSKFWNLFKNIIYFLNKVLWVLRFTLLPFVLEWVDLMRNLYIFCLEGVKVSIGFPGCSGNKFYLRISEIPLIRIV